MSDHQPPEHGVGHEPDEEPTDEHERSDASVDDRERSDDDTTPLRVEQGDPGDEALLAFLNAAFDGWGPRPYFEWKYDRYPGYRADAHNFYVTDADGRLVASRRLFEKELVLPDTDERVGFFIHGGAAVAHDYRGRGLFSELVDASRAYSREQDAPLVMTFNRRGKVSTLAHLKHDWSHRELPLYVRVLSARTAVSEYAEDLLRDRPRLARVVRRLAPRVAVSDGRLRLDGSPHASPRLGVRLSDEAVRTLVEIAGGKTSRWESLRALAGLVVGGHVGVGRLREPDNGTRRQSSTLPADVTVHDELDAQTLDAVVSLFETANGNYDVAFRRAHADVRHQLEYPGAQALTVSDDGELTGFAAVGFLARGSATEARVLDAVAATDDDFRTLVEAIETLATDRGADIIAFISDDDPGPSWARVATDLVMWDWLDRDEGLQRRLERGRWRVRIYDAM